jgi:hypothetical protein
MHAERYAGIRNPRHNGDDRVVVTLIPGATVHLGKLLLVMRVANNPSPLKD